MTTSAPSSTSRDPWADALDILQTTRLTPTELSEHKHLLTPPQQQVGTGQPSSPSPPSYTALTTAIALAKAKRAECEQQKYAITRRRGPSGQSEKIYLRDQVGGILESLQTFSTSLGPVALAVGQAFPPIGIVWGCFCTALSMATSDIETYSKLMTALDEVVTIMMRTKAYEALYSPSPAASKSAADAAPPPYNASATPATAPSEGRDRLLTSLPGLYAAILLFSVRAAQYFGKSSWKRMVKSIHKPFLVEFQPLLDEILTQEMAVTKEVGLILAEDSTNSLLFHQTTHIQLNVITQKVSTLQALLEEEVQEEHLRRAEREAVKQRVQDEMSRSVRLWLKPVETDYERERSWNSYKKGTCEWVLKEDDFVSWVAEEDSEKGETRAKALRVVGIPGAGKSVLSAFLINRFRQPPATSSEPASQSPIVLHFFFKNRSSDSNKVLHLLRNLIVQLLDYSPTSPPPSASQPNPPSNLFLSMANTERVNTGAPHAAAVEKLWDLFVCMLSLLGEHRPVYIVVDALDECTDRDESRLAEKILALCTTAKLNAPVRIFLTSRPEPDIELAFPDPAVLPKILLSALHVSADIRLYITEQIRTKHPKLLRYEAKIVEPVVRMSAGMFRYAALMLVDLSVPSKLRLVDRLATLPAGIYELYELILEKLPQETLDLRQTVYRWLCLANRELSISELALIYSTEGNEKFDIDGVMLVEADDIMAACGTLVEIDEGQRVRFSHLSVKEFLLLPPGRMRSKDGLVLECLVDKMRGQLIVCTTIFTMLASENFRERYFEEMDDVNRGAYETGGMYMQDVKKLEDKQEATVELKDVLGEVGPQEEDRELSKESSRASWWGRRLGMAGSINRVLNWLSPATNGQQQQTEALGATSTENTVPEIVIDSGEDNQGQAQPKEEEKGKRERGDHDNEDKEDGEDEADEDEDEEEDEGEEAEKEEKNEEEESGKYQPRARIIFHSDYSASVVDPEAYAANRARGIDYGPRASLLYPVTEWMWHLRDLEARPEHPADDDDSDWNVGLSRLDALVDAFMATDTEHFRQWQRVFARATVRFAGRNFNLDVAGDCYSTALHMAASYDLPRLAARLLAGGRDDPHRTDSFGSTPLHWAACFRAPRVLTLLLDHGCPVQVRNLKLGNTPLHTAAYNRNVPLSCLAALLDRAPGRGLALLNAERETLLHRACRGGNSAAVGFLLGWGFDPNVRDQALETPLHEACMSNEPAVAAALLAHNADAGALEQYGSAPLHYAASNDKAQTVALLLAHGADANLRHGPTQMTALHFAARRCHLGTIKILAAGGCDLLARDSSGRTALHHAARKGHPATIAYLLAQPGLAAIADAPDAHGTTALLRAAKNGHAKAIGQFISAGADVNTRDCHGRTALFSIAWRGRKWAVGEEPPLSLYAGYDSVKACLLCNCFECWQDHRYIECARLLLDARADPSVEVAGVSAVPWLKSVGLATGLIEENAIPQENVDTLQ
ncbi:hypothetical protein DFH27DRAFT_520239 [Peziza echinospora]|nr:hypothetical protein DFH27DRAFT_520239 [Peziza echinospora]